MSSAKNSNSTTQKYQNANLNNIAGGKKEPGVAVAAGAIGSAKLGYNGMLVLSKVWQHGLAAFVQG